MSDAPTGPAAETKVEPTAEEDFSSHFAEFASDTPDPNDGKSDEENDADQAGGGEGDLPDDTDPPADAPGDQPAAGNPNPDPWASAPADLIALRDRERAEWERRMAGASGRASGLQRQLNELTAKAAKPPKQEAAEGEKAPEDMSDEEWKAFEEDYPEIAKFIAPLRSKLSNVERTVVPISEARAAEAEREAIATLEKEHSDFRFYGDPTNPEFAAALPSLPKEAQELNASFHGWLGEQRPAIQALYTSDDPADAASILRLFKSERAAAMNQGGGEQPKPNDATSAKRARQLDGGRHVGSRPGSAATGAPDDDFEGAFNHYSARQQRRRG